MTREDQSLWIQTNPTDAPQYTVGPIGGDDLVIVDADGVPVTLKEDQWSLIEVLPRGRELYDRSKFSREAPDRKKKATWSTS